MKPLAVTLMPRALILLAALEAGQAIAQSSPPAQKAILEYSPPTSATWGPSATAPPTFAFGRPAVVQLVVPGGYHVRQELPVEDAIAQAAYVSQQLGHPIAVTIPDPAGGPPRVTYVGRDSGDLGK